MWMPQPPIRCGSTIPMRQPFAPPTLSFRILSRRSRSRRGAAWTPAPDAAAWMKEISMAESKNDQNQPTSNQNKGSGSDTASAAKISAGTSVGNVGQSPPMPQQQTGAPNPAQSSTLASHTSSPLGGGEAGRLAGSSGGQGGQAGNRDRNPGASQGGQMGGRDQHQSGAQQGG